MTEQPKKLSRRDAIKLIGAATGASVLATLPTKWTKPEMTTGTLPAHALTSVAYSIVSCDPNYFVSSQIGVVSGILSVFIMPAVAGMSLNLAITNNNGVIVNTDPSGTYQTNSSGQANSSNLQFTSSTPGSSITLEWRFALAPPQATSCQTTYFWT